MGVEVPAHLAQAIKDALASGKDYIGKPTLKNLIAYVEESNNTHPYPLHLSVATNLFNTLKEYLSSLDDSKEEVPVDLSFLQMALSEYTQRMDTQIRSPKYE